MKMTKIMGLFVALAMVLVFGSGVMAQNYDALGDLFYGVAPQVRMETYSGVLESVDHAAQSFVVKNNSGWMTFYWDNNTQITHGQRTLSPMDLKTGEHLTVAYREEGAKVTVDRVDVSGRESSMQGESQIY